MLGARSSFAIFVPFIGTCSILDTRLHNVGHLAVEPAEKSPHSFKDGAILLDDETTEAKRRLWSIRLCNAYAVESSVEVFHSHGRLSGLDYTNASGSKRQQLTKGSGPLPYKRCADVDGVDVGVNSILEFRIGEMPIGTFVVNDLPASGTLLQLAIKRRDTWSTAADFSSHIFTVSSGPQVALVDAYLGESKSYLEVWDAAEFPPKARLSFEKGEKRHQEVSFGTIIEVAPGDYDWLLKDISGYEKIVVEFKATEQSLYTVLRVGAEAIGGQSFQEELVVWPREGVIVRRGDEKPKSKKGLFGIPKDFLKSAASFPVRLAFTIWLLLLGFIARFDIV